MTADVDLGVASQSTVPRTSLWAAASLLCSLAFCCPAMAVLGPLFGFRALVQIKADPNLRGRHLARAGIFIGILGIVLWVVGMFWWHANARVPMMKGPLQELHAGLNGDVTRFKSGFTGDGARAPDMEARKFLQELSRRYGRIMGAAQREPLPGSTPPAASSPSQAPMAAIIRIPYTFHFDRRTVDAEAAFMTFGVPRFGLPNPVFDWVWVRVIDPEQGDLVYPLSASGQASATMPIVNPASP